MDTPNIDTLAALARISVPKGQKQALQKDIQSILSFVGHISDAPVSHEEKEAGVPHNVLRPDTHPHESGIYTELLLKEAPEQKDGYVKVKNIF